MVPVDGGFRPEASGRALPVESGRISKTWRMMELRRYKEGDVDALARLGVAAFDGGVSDWERYFDPSHNAR